MVPSSHALRTENNRQATKFVHNSPKSTLSFKNVEVLFV